jgi:hypothetical protein
MATPVALLCPPGGKRSAGTQCVRTFPPEESSVTRRASRSATNTAPVGATATPTVPEKPVQRTSSLPKGEYFETVPAAGSATKTFPLSPTARAAPGPALVDAVYRQESSFLPPVPNFTMRPVAASAV